MKTWNIGNTTVRNPKRLREALQLFVIKMSGRPFRRDEQREFQGALIDAELVDSTRYEGDDGGRKFASAFKQLGFVTDWSHGKAWEVTPVGALLLQHPQIEETIFLRQLLKYQIPSPLETVGTSGFHVRPFRLLLRFLHRARTEGLIGLTKFEVGLFVITVLTEDQAEFEDAIAKIKAYRTEYDALQGKVAKTKFAFERFNAAAAALGLEPGTFRDYADSNIRYALMSGLLSLRGNKLALSEARLPFIEALLTDGAPFVADSDYLEPYFHNTDAPALPTDDESFLAAEIATLVTQVKELAARIREAFVIPQPPTQRTLAQLQAYEIALRNELRRLREIQFYREQGTQLDEIEELLEDINNDTLAGGAFYAPAYFEWAIWRMFLAINHIRGPIEKTRGFNIDIDMHPTHHARGGAADLRFTYDDFELVCEMTLTSGSRQFSAEGEPVTRHVFLAASSSDKPVYGLFVANKLDPNTANAFHKARYWRDWKTSAIPTPVIALETKQVLALIQRMRSQPVSVAELRGMLDGVLALQDQYQDGPSWYKAYSALYETWSNSPSAPSTARVLKSQDQ